MHVNRSRKIVAPTDVSDLMAQDGFHLEVGQVRGQPCRPDERGPEEADHTGLKLRAGEPKLRSWNTYRLFQTAEDR